MPLPQALMYADAQLMARLKAEKSAADKEHRQALKKKGRAKKKGRKGAGLASDEDEDDEDSE